MGSNTSQPGCGCCGFWEGWEMSASCIAKHPTGLHAHIRAGYGHRRG
jgi:hypothetical protein